MPSTPPTPPSSPRTPPSLPVEQPLEVQLLDKMSYSELAWML